MDGLDDLAVAGDLARQVGARLDDQRLGVGRRLQDRERHADQVVEVGPGGVGAYRVRSTAASISFVLVFPLVPVTAMTGPVRIRRRRARARSP